MARVLFELAALDLLDDVDEPLIGARLNSDLLAFAHDKALEKLDLCAPALAMALTLWPLASSIAVRLRPMAPMAPAAPVTRIGLSCVDFIIISLA